MSGFNTPEMLSMGQTSPELEDLLNHSSADLTFLCGHFTFFPRIGKQFQFGL